MTPEPEQGHESSPGKPRNISIMAILSGANQYQNMTQAREGQIITVLHADKGRCIGMAYLGWLRKKKLYRKHDTGNITIGDKQMTHLTSEKSPKLSFNWANNVATGLTASLTSDT